MGGTTDILRKLRNISDEKIRPFPRDSVQPYIYFSSLACLTCFSKEPNAVPVLGNVPLSLTWQEDA